MCGVRPMGQTILQFEDCNLTTSEHLDILSSKSSKMSIRTQSPKPIPQALDEFPGLAGTYSTILVDPPWRFLNRTGKVAPEHRRLHRYQTMSFEEIGKLPVAKYAREKAHLYMWCPNALLPEALGIMKEWGFTYKTNIVWYKVRKDGGPDGRCVGFYFRNVTELLLFGIKGSMRTLAP